MNSGARPAPKRPTKKQLAEAETKLKSEAEAIEKLRVQLSAQGSSADKNQLAEFAMRQKEYLDGKINFEKLKRGAEVNSTLPALPRTTAPTPPKAVPAPVQKPAPIKTAAAKPVPANPKKIPPVVIAKPRRPEFSRTNTAPVQKAEKSHRPWVLLLLLAVAAGLIVWLMR